MGERRNHYDVTNTVPIARPDAVCTAVCEILAETYPGADLAPVRAGFDTFTRLYSGTLPGYRACETWYHDAQHSLDCALAMARLTAGHEQSEPKASQLGARRGVLGILIALFHDAGYIRRDGDSATHGAEFTLFHVARSGEFLARFLPTVGYAREVPLVQQVVHFTGYEVALEHIRVRAPKDRMLGFLLGTADILAQTADRCYLEKCRDFLYPEFERCGLAGAPKPGAPKPVYRTREALLKQTPAFNAKLRKERLDGYFGSVHRYLETYFGGENPYVEAIEQHLRRLRRLLRENNLDSLRRRPRVVGAKEMRRSIRPQRNGLTMRKPSTPWPSAKSSVSKRRQPADKAAASTSAS